MNLSLHFTKEEFEYSDTAKAKGIKNVMNEAQTKEAIHTAVYMLEPIRKLLNDTYKTYAGKAVKQVSLRITSGFRGKELNLAVGGVSTSQHCKAQAADLEATVTFTDGSKKVLPYNELYETIKKAVRAGKVTVDQCIEECTTKNGKIISTWVHCSLADQLSKCRKEFLIYKNGKYTLDK